MATKKSKSVRSRGGAVKQPGKQRKPPQGKPFAKGNQFAFKPGQSGNPAGRPKSVKYLSEAYRQWLAQPSDADPDRTNADMVAEVVGRQALTGDMAAVREICDRAEGKARQALDITIEEEKRKIIENAILSLMDETGLDRDGAIDQLSKLKPDIKQLVN